VVSVDQAGGKVQLTHGPLPEVGWPGMTMTFDAKHELFAASLPATRWRSISW